MQADQVQESVRPVGRTQVDPAHVDAWLDSMRGQPADRQVRLLQLHYTVRTHPFVTEWAADRFKHLDRLPDRRARVLAQLVVGTRLQGPEFGPWLLDRMQHGDLQPAVRHAFEALHVRRAGPVQPWG